MAVCKSVNANLSAISSVSSLHQRTPQDVANERGYMKIAQFLRRGEIPDVSA